MPLMTGFSVDVPPEVPVIVPVPLVCTVPVTGVAPEPSSME